jgi:hypothetical protein
LFFDLATDFVEIIMNNSKNQGIVRGEVVNGINMLQLAEDIVFLLPNNT